jgi:hypothetical protein
MTLEFETRTNACPICEADVDLPADMFATMAEMPKIVSRAFREPRDHAGDGWTPHEIAAHLADIEVGLGWRIRITLSDDAPTLQVFNQETWATALNYKERDLATSLATYSANRQSSLELLRRAGNAGLNRPFRHAEFGEHPLRVLIEHIADHDVAHLRQLRGE